MVMSRCVADTAIPSSMATCLTVCRIRAQQHNSVPCCSSRAVQTYIVAVAAQVRRSRCSCLLQDNACIKTFLKTNDVTFLIKHCSNTPMRKDPQGRCAACATKDLKGAHLWCPWLRSCQWLWFLHVPSNLKQGVAVAEKSFVQPHHLLPAVQWTQLSARWPH